MEEALPAPRPELSPHAPKILRIKVNPEKIGLVIGSGGRTIREIQRRTGTEVEFDDEGGFAVIVGRTLESAQECGSMITSIIEGLKVGEIKHAKVVELRDFGAFVEVIPTGEQGMIHVSEVSDAYVDNVAEYLKIGDEIDVKVISVDDMGKVRMSLKQANQELNKPAREAIYQGAAAPQPRRPAGRGGPGRGGPRGGPPRGGPRRGGGGGGGGPRGPRRDGDRHGGPPRGDRGGGGGGPRGGRGGGGRRF
jgi:polyribonucleotide nucleotidyltransferase